MATLNMIPNANYFVDALIAVKPSGDAYAAIDDTPGSPDDADYLYGNPEKGIDSYFLAYFDIPDLTISNITISNFTLYYRGSVAENGLFYGLLYIGNTLYYSEARNSASATTYSKDYTTNPNTGASWTISDINSLRIGCRHGNNGVAKALSNVYQVYGVLTYTVNTSAVGSAALLLI